MSKKSIILLSVFVVLILVICILYIVLAVKKTTPNNPGYFVSVGQQNSTTTTGTETISGNTSTVMPIELSTGQKVVVPDFTKTNQPLAASATSGYQVAGSSLANFQILYFPKDSYFLISLFTEPLGDTRKAAEGQLRAQLKLSDAQLCKLHIDVNTLASVNQTYAGENLGLSFCPGSVQLP
jgi:hypothetical protein